MANPIKVKFREWDCVVEKHRYANGRTAIRLIDEHDETSSIAMATVNLPDEPMAADEVAIKDYSENEGMLAALTEAGVVEPSHRVCVSGYVTVPVCRVRV